MDAHSRHIFTALHALLAAALACAPRNEALNRTLRSALAMVGDELGLDRPCISRAERWAAKAQ